MTLTGLEKVQSTAVFDYSQLDEQTAQTLQNYSFRALQVARTYYRDLMEIVVGAHKLLCGTVVPVGDNGRFVAKEDTFRAWCASVHISKTKAYQLLQIQDFMNNCTPEQQSTLALLPFTAMRELVTSDTPEQVIAMAKEGKVGTSKEVLELKAQLKAEKDRADAAEAERDKLLGAQNRAAWAESHIQDVESQRNAALADVQGLTEQNAQLKAEKEKAERSYNEMYESRIVANLQRQKAEAERDRAEARVKDAENQLAGARQVAQAAKLRGDKLKAENDALKHQPITAVVDEEETRRQAEEMSRKAKEQAARQVQEAQRATAAVQAEFERFRQAADGFLAPEQVCTQQAQMIANAMRSMYLNWCGQAVAAGAPLAQMGAPLYALCGEIQTSLEEDTTINPTAAGSVEDAEREALFE